MKELFLQDLSVLGVLSLLAIAMWVVLVLSNRLPKAHIWIFMISHYLLYIDTFFFDAKSLFLVGCIILVLTLCFCFRKTFKNEKFRWVYILLGAFLLLLLAFVFAISKMDISFLALR